jgi:transposase
VVDGHGHPLNLTLSTANRHDSVQLLQTIDGIQIGQRKRKPKRLGLDKGYDSEPHRRALRQRRIIPIARYRCNHVTRSRGRPPKDWFEQRFCYQRWKVERSFSWFNNQRRLDRFLEQGQITYLAFSLVFFIKHYLHLLFYDTK